ncbi:MAG TPA: SET domain-containing protein-lysine N-methyltransferase [Anaerolineales bacterium]|nr:SET domain-containing protein-lysine N-methyltransferase [Anaerolineales bacterium]HNN12884.1 SET domain-containing protein-lysine N-methyltransferase [Anaerolineales bacterium]HNO31597.1 SET domain-containing protein-lysine N-methyltransferase [Anaerolineales bacterium]
MSQSYLNQKCEAREHPTGGCAVYAILPIYKGEVVSLWGGLIVQKSELDPAMPRFTQRVLQIDEDLYILTAERPEPNDCFNHSCEPSLGFSGQIALVAMRDIAAGEELTFDYAMSDGGPYDEFDCACGSPFCRGRVTGNDWKLPELWARYEGYFSNYLARRIEKIKTNS